VIVRNPLTQPLSFLGLEVVVLVCAALTFAHALGRLRRSGDRLPLFTWIAILSYGVVMELVSYNTVDNFTHGPFTVMLYHGKLPLYVVAVYPVLLYTGITLARRLGLARWAEPLVAGLAIVLLDVPFDVLGPDQGWWSWSPTDVNIAARWEGVPLTSYYWHIAFGACLALLTRSCERWLKLGWTMGLAPLVGAMTIVAGGLSFIPFHLLQNEGVSDGANLAILVTVCLGALLFGRRGAPVERPDRILLTTALAYHALFLLVLLTRSSVEDGAQKAAILLVGTACSVGLHLYGQIRGIRQPLAARA
jgi:hypothetical protein